MMKTNKLNIMTIVALGLLSTISVAEARWHNERPQFTQIDFNVDGTIDSAEFEQFHQQRMDERKAHGHMMRHDKQEGMFDIIDQNQDGLLSTEEFSQHQTQGCKNW